MAQNNRLSYMAKVCLFLFLFVYIFKPQSLFSSVTTYYIISKCYLCDLFVVLYTTVYLISSNGVYKNSICIPDLFVSHVDG